MINDNNSPIPNFVIKAAIRDSVKEVESLEDNETLSCIYAFIKTMLDWSKGGVFNGE